MPGTTPTPANYGSNVNENVLPNFMEGITWDNTLRQSALLDKLNGRGRVMADGDGKYIDLLATVGYNTDRAHVDGGQRNWQRQTQQVTYTFPWNIREMTEVLTENDIMFLSSAAARNNYAKGKLTSMSEDFADLLNNRLFNEHNASNTTFGVAPYSGSDVPLYGLPTMFGYGTDTASSAIALDDAGKEFDRPSNGGTVAAGDKDVRPNDTYGGQATDPISAISGITNPIVEGTSPVLVNWSHTSWNSAGLTTWYANCREALSYTINRVWRGNTERNRPDCAFLGSSMYEDMKNKLIDDAYLQVNVGDKPQRPDMSMYARRMIPFDGLEVIMDRMCPANAVFVVNTAQMSYKYWPNPLIMAKGLGNAVTGKPGTKMFGFTQQYDIDPGGVKILGKHVGQLVCNPRYQAALFNFA